MTDINTRAQNILSELTAIQKISLLTGADAWHTAEYAEAGLPAITMRDGPSGVRTYGKGALCFPSGCALGSSFSRETVRRVGELLGEETANNGVNLLLAPAVNIKRSPLCGRNFEYYSEDPYLTGELAYSYITGVQKNAGCCVKHFAVNNQESKRMSVNAIVSDRALADIYLRSFERAVSAKPLAVMSSYNKVNGVYASENSKLLNKTLFDEWGYDGMVISDWGAVNDIVKSVKGGLSIEMPSNKGNTEVLIKAYGSDGLTGQNIDVAALRAIKSILRAAGYKKCETDYDAHLSECAVLGEECCVLLKNDNNILPVTDSQTVIAAIGEGAVNPRFQGGGCANITPAYISNPLEAIKKRFKNVRYCSGKDLSEAVSVAEQSDVCIIFAGLGEKDESEGYDRKSIAFPAEQTKLIKAVSKVNPNTVVILTQGGVTELPFKNNVGAILLTYLLGSAYGETVARLISGEGEPSGRLAESWIAHDCDASAYPYYGNGGNVAEYGEGVFVGYRHYCTVGRKVNYPFGYGLSYTEFEQSGTAISATSGGVNVTTTVTNVGKRSGKTVVQVYAKVLNNDLAHLECELVGFTKVSLNAGESRQVGIFVPFDALRRYSYTEGKRVLYSNYLISVRENANKVITRTEIEFNAAKSEYTPDTCIGTILREHPEYAELLKPYVCLAILGNFNADVQIVNGEAVGDPVFTHIMQDMPLRALYNLTGGKFSLREFLNTIT